MAATSSTMTVPTVEEGATEVADVAETATMGVAGGLRGGERAGRE